MLLTPTHLLSSENCHHHLTHLLPLPHLHLYCFAKLSHLAGEVNDSGQGLEAEGMRIFLERINWADPSLVFPSLGPSAVQGLGLGREEATSGTA